MNTGLNQKGSKSFHSYTLLQQQIINFSISFKKSLTISSFNIQSLLNKFHEISFKLELQLIDILVLNETWLDQNIDNNLFENSFYQMIRRDRTISSGGGIIVYIKKSIQVKSIIIDEAFETISFVFQLQNKFQISVISCYRPESLIFEYYEKFFFKITFKYRSN
jgi:hypothetical protein